MLELLGLIKFIFTLKSKWKKFGQWSCDRSISKNKFTKRAPLPINLLMYHCILSIYFCTTVFSQFTSVPLYSINLLLYHCILSIYFCTTVFYQFTSVPLYSINLLMYHCILVMLNATSKLNSNYLFSRTLIFLCGCHSRQKRRVEKPSCLRAQKSRGLLTPKFSIYGDFIK